MPQHALGFALAAPVALAAPLVLAAAAMRTPMTLASSMPPGRRTLAVASAMGVRAALPLGMAGLVPGVEMGRGTAPPVRIGRSSLVACGPPGAILH
ncbi:MAG: hypothetical protein ACREAA_16465 [Candidatus Polarisedimenticolia bacterium]